MEQRQYLTVSALNRYIKAIIDNNAHLNKIFIQGELSNVKYHQSGHCYFTLKDEKSRINAVMFSSQVKKLNFILEDGMKVLLSCRLSVYEPSGTYQLYVENAQIDGIGNLYVAYEQLKEKLERQGLFSVDHKKALPKYPTKIGIITASSGAAIHDITRTLHSTCPSCELYFYPSLVQGDEAPNSLIKRLKQADNDRLDVIIIGRGGGSLEDLWAFNNERLAYEIYQAKTPIISGVGHESDVTICDFVADYRAATPTAAATAACFNQNDLLQLLSDIEYQMKKSIKNQINHEYLRLAALSDKPYFKNPLSLIQTQMQRVDDLTNTMMNQMKFRFDTESQKVLFYSQHLCENLKNNYYLEKEKVSYLKKRIDKEMFYKYQISKNLFEKSVSNLNALNPLNVLSRGYTITRQNSKIVTSIKDVDMSEKLEIQFKDGNLNVEIKGE